MTKENTLACEILKSMDVAILKRIAPRTYDFFGHLPDFYHDIFCDAAGQPSRQPWTLSPMLDFFLNDVEYFFEQKKAGVLTSSMWQEDGKTNEETALISMATAYDEHQILIIRLLRDYQERVVGLRHARNQLLQNRTLSSHLEYYKEKSRIDSLTKIFNKTTFMDLLQNEIKRSVMLNYSLALLFIDIDNFKEINDTYGHLVGDVVLKKLGTILSNSLRQNDIIARFGGEEFIALIPQANEKQTFTIADKLREKIATTKDKDIPQITVSIGYSLYTAHETIEKFISRADAALYKAKMNGKNRVYPKSKTSHKAGIKQ